MKDPRLLVSLAAYATATAFFYHFTLDDAGITLRYAQNLAHHGVLSFNLDERVYGTTTLFWALITTPVMLLDRWVDPLIACKVLSFVFGAAGVVALHRLARHMRLSVYVFFMSATVLAVPYVLFAYSAMEFGLAALLLALFLNVYVAGYSRSGLRSLAWLGIAIFFTRPEFVLITVPLLCSFGLSSRTDVRRDSIVLVRAAATAVLLLGAVWIYYGSIMPLSVEAKMHYGRPEPGFLNGFARISGWSLKQGLVVPFAIAAIWWAASGRVRSSVDRRPTAWLLACGVLFLGFFMLQGGRVVMDDGGRYYYPGFLLVALGVAHIIDAALSDAARGPGRIATSAGILAMPVIAIAALYFVKTDDMNLHTVEGKKFSADGYAELMNETYIPLGKHLREHYPSSTRLLVRDAGLIPFYSGFDNVLDAWSLNDPRIVRCDRKCSASVATRYTPDLIVQGGNHVKDFSRAYRRVRVFLSSQPRRSLPLYERRR